MEFDTHIEKIGQLDNTFGFYKYLVKRYDLKKHNLLESSAINTCGTLKRIHMKINNSKERKVIEND